MEFVAFWNNSDLQERLAGAKIFHKTQSRLRGAPAAHEHGCGHLYLPLAGLFQAGNKCSNPRMLHLHRGLVDHQPLKTKSKFISSPE